MDDTERLFRLVGKTLGAAAEAKARAAAKRQTQPEPTLPGQCWHDVTTAQPYQTKNGSQSFREVCANPDCGEVLRFVTKTQAAHLALAAIPPIKDYVPDPDVAEECFMEGCDQPGTVEHHLLMEHIFGPELSQQGGTRWACADHHALIHRALHLWGQRRTR